MNRLLKPLAAAFLIAFLVSAAACTGAAPSPTPQPTATEAPQPFELVLLHTNDVRGYTEPCG